MEISELKIKLGDIIQIKSSKTDYDLKYFFIEYVDDELMKIVNIDNGNKDSLDLDKDGCLIDTTIEKIFLLSRSDKEGYAMQNGLEPETYIKLIFEDDIEIIGKIVNLEEDMIEIEKMDDREHIFIDFEYKGIPQTIPLKNIVIIEQPSVQEVIEKKEEKKEKEKAKAKEEDEKKEEKDDKPSSIEYSPEGDIIINISENAPIDSVSTTDDYMIGKKIEFFADVEVKESEQRYGIEIQTNDLLDELLSKIPDKERTIAVMERVYRIIRRFKELRQNFSVFDKNENITDYKRIHPTYKPLVEHMNNLDTNLRWIIPVVKQKVKIYAETLAQNIENDFVSDSYVFDDVQNYINNLEVYKENNNYSSFYNGINTIFTPFEKYKNEDDTSILKLNSDIVKTDLEAIVDNLENYYTYVYKKSNEIGKKRFLIQRYNLGMTKISNKKMRSGKSVYIRENIGNSDPISIKSVIMLPKPVLEFSRVSLPGTNILTRTNLSQNWLYHFKMLTKKTSFSKINIDNVDKEYEYQEGETEENKPFLETALSFNISNSIHPDYKTMLETIIPRSSSIIRLLKSEYIGYNFYDMLAFFEPFLIYADNITYAGIFKSGAYQELRTHVIANIKNYEKRIFEQRKKYDLLKKIKSVDNTTNAIFEFVKLEMQNQIKKEYGIKNENVSASEVLSKLIEMDHGNFYISLCSIIMSHLYVPELSNLFDSSKYGEEAFSKSKACLTHVIAKKYTSLSSLQKDDGKEEVYYDKEFDTTSYDILKKYQDTQKKMSPENFLDYFTLVLKNEHGVEMAEAVAKTIIAKKKLVEENNYAVLIIYPKLNSAFDENSLSKEEKKSVEIEADVKKRVFYFKRKGNNWVKDTEMTDSELTNEIFCNSDKNCFYDKSNEICDIAENAATRMKKIAKKHLYESEVELTLEEFKQKLNKLYESKEMQIKKTRLIKEAKSEEFSLRAYYIGSKANLTDIVVSPYAEIREQVLSHMDFGQKQEMIYKFQTNYCRYPIEGESTYWLYCKETNTKLLPKFLFLLAQSFPLGLYEDTLDTIISTQGKISDDGDAIVDKHSGYVITYRDLVAQDEFNDEGFVIKTHDVIEKDEDEQIEEMIDAAIEGNQTNLTKPNKQKPRIFTDITDQYIYNVSNAISKSLDINIQEIDNQILYFASNIITSSLLTKEQFDEKKDETKKLSYETYKNNHIFYITAAVTFIFIQAQIPSFQNNKTYRGCVFNLSGYPLDNSSNNNSGLKYLCCVLEKIKSTASEPWKSVSRFKSDQHLSRIEEKLKKNVLKNPKIQRMLELKRNYLILKPEKLFSFEEQNVEKKWLLFQPPLIHSGIEKTVSGVSNAIDGEIKESLKTGNRIQHQHIGNIYKKIIEHTYSTVDNINKIIVKDGKDAMLKAGSIVFLENSCCEELNVEKPIRYFEEKDENIKKNIEFIQKYEKIYDGIKSLSIPAFANSRMKKTIYISSGDSDNFNDENIYSAYIHYCKLTSDLPIPLDLQDICQEKIVGLNTMSLEESIKVLSDNGRNQNKETLTILMRKIFLRNQIEISFIDEDITSFFDLTIQDNIHNRIKIALETKDSNTLDAFLTNLNKKMQEDIFEYLIRYGGLANNEIQKKNKQYVGSIADFVQNMDDWSDLKKIPRFVKNTINNIINTIPSMLVNDGIKNTDMTKTKKYWNFAPMHYENLTGFVDNYFEEIQSYDRDKNVCSLFQDIHIDEELNNINLLVSQLVTIASAFDEKLICKIYKYCYLSVFYKIIIESDSKDIDVLITEQDTEEGTEVVIQDKQQFFQQVSKLIVILLNIDMKNKKMINFSYSDLSEKFHKDSLAEKKKITDKLKKMSKSDRNVENTMKKYKLGDWFTDDSVYKYDKSKYEEDVVAVANATEGAEGADEGADEGFVLEEGDEDRENNDF
jgi:hypothetical protein